MSLRVPRVGALLAVPMPALPDRAAVPQVLPHFLLLRMVATLPYLPDACQIFSRPSDRRERLSPGKNHAPLRRPVP